MMLWLLLISALELHGIAGRHSLQIPAWNLKQTTLEGDLMAEYSGTWLLRDALVLRFRGALGAVASRGEPSLVLGTANLVPVASWFSSVDTLWHHSRLSGGKVQQSLGLLAVEALSLEYQWHTLAVEAGRFPVPLGLNPWLSVLDPLRPVPRVGPFLAFSGVDGLQAVFRGARAEGRLFWIPTPRDTLRRGGILRLYLPWMDGLVQYLQARDERHLGLGLQHNLLQGVLRWEFAFWWQNQRFMPDEPAIQSVEAPRNGAYEMSYTRTWGDWTLDLILLTSDRPEFQVMGQEGLRFLGLLGTERLRWGGQVGLDKNLDHAAGLVWLEAHYWWTSSLRLWLWATAGLWKTPAEARLRSLLVGLSLYD